MPSSRSALPSYAIARQARRAVYDETTIHHILDHGLVAHVGFVAADRPMVMPMAYGRDGSTLYLHGASKTRLIRDNRGGTALCLTVTLLDGIVVARSAFHHSMNYRSAVVHGDARAVDGRDEHEHALRVIVEHLLPGRWPEVRPMLDKERKATGVLALPITAASAKVRTGGPVDEEQDYEQPVWAGVLPLATQPSTPIADDRLPAGVTVPASLYAAQRKLGC